MSETVNIVIVDDHPLVRQGLQSILESFGDIQVVGTACNGEQAVTVCCAEQPDVVLMDVNLKDTTGIEVMGRIQTHCEDIKVLMLSSFDDDIHVQEAMDHGAIGYMLKTAEINELAEAIHAARDGKRTLSPEALEVLIRNRPKRKIIDNELTSRELEVLRLLARGLTNGDIATQLTISLSTVKFHTGTIYKKLNVKNRSEAVAKAVSNQLVEVN